MLRSNKLLIALIALSILLAACAGGASPTAAPPTSAGGQATTAPAQPTTAQPSGQAIEITVLSNFTPDVARGKVLAALADEFNKQHEGKIKVTLNTDPDWPALQAKIKSLIAAGTPPDVFLYNYNANDLTREKSGKLMDWKPYLDADPEWKAKFRPENLQALTIDGQIVGIPSDQSPVLFYYHKDLFDKAGITSFPKTWDEFWQAADKLKASGVAPIAMFTADDAWHAMNAFTAFGVSAGGKDVFQPGQPLDSPAVVKAAEELKKLFQYTTPDAVGANYSVSSRNFISKKAAMVIDGPWLISSIQKEVAQPCNVAVAAIPTYGDNKVPAGFIITDSMNPWAAAKQSSKEREQAIVEWMKFYTSDASAKRMSVEGEYPQAMKLTFTDQDKANANCNMAQVLDLSSQAPLGVVEAVRNIKPSAQSELPGMLEALALGTLTPEDFAKKLQAAAQ
ncbi:MAG TPA: extracellular solute-binding protein [Anaerolineae bacterium]|nr:extracellular solute-binding protein [Anaerolineae bacterium]